MRPTQTLDTAATRHVASPVGALTLVARGSGLVAILWEGDDPRRVPLGAAEPDPHHPVLREVERQLAAYFAGRRRRFDLPLAGRGTDFQKRVWEELRRIPYGETRSYGQIARALGDPNLMRAVGAANGRNPLSIVVPCHRVVGAAGQLTGFAGGLDAKAYLLGLEGRARQPDLFASGLRPAGSSSVLRPKAG